MYCYRHFSIHSFLATFVLLTLCTTVESKPTSRVINGKPAEIENFPWMVYLFVNDENDRGHRECGGSLIDQQWVLTAAHCFLNDDDDKINLNLGSHVSVLVNSTTLTPMSQGAKRVQSAFVIVHPEFNPITLEFDLALLRLSEPVTEEPITLLSDDGLSMVDTEVTVVGWGATALNGQNTAINFSNTLLKTEQLIVSNEFCQSVYTGSSHITDNMICANGVSANDSSDTCTGDSGGPMAIQQNNTFIQVGITSFGGANGVLCGSSTVPGVYTRISPFIDYITQYVPNVKLSALYAKRGSALCTAATVDPALNINIPCVMMNNGAYEATLNKTEKEGFSWSFEGVLNQSRCFQDLKKCTTVDDQLGLTVKGEAGVTGILKFEGNIEKNHYLWGFERAFVE